MNYTPIPMILTEIEAKTMRIFEFVIGRYRIQLELVCEIVGTIM